MGRKKVAVLIKYDYIAWLKNAGLTGAECFEIIEAASDYDQSGRAAQFGNPVQTVMWAIIKTDIDKGRAEYFSKFKGASPGALASAPAEAPAPGIVGIVGINGVNPNNDQKEALPELTPLIPEKGIHIHSHSHLPLHHHHHHLLPEQSETAEGADDDDKTTVFTEKEPKTASGPPLEPEPPPKPEAASMPQPEPSGPAEWPPGPYNAIKGPPYPACTRPPGVPAAIQQAEKPPGNDARTGPPPRAGPLQETEPGLMAPPIARVWEQVRKHWNARGPKYMCDRLYANLSSAAQDRVRGALNTYSVEALMAAMDMFFDAIKAGKTKYEYESLYSFLEKGVEFYT